jgi:hypothetical protein
MPYHETVIAKHAKSGRWTVVAEFHTTLAAHNYAAGMNRESKSHVSFEVIVGDWSAAKKECVRRNKKASGSRKSP